MTYWPILHFDSFEIGTKNRKSFITEKPHIFWGIAVLVLLSSYFLKFTPLFKELRQRFFELELEHCTLTKTPLRILILFHWYCNFKPPTYHKGRNFWDHKLLQNLFLQLRLFTINFWDLDILWNYGKNVEFIFAIPMFWQFFLTKSKKRYDIYGNNLYVFLFEKYTL